MDNFISKNKKRQLSVVAFCFFMQTLDSTIINTSLPSIARSFNVDMSNIHLVITSYILSEAAVLPASGWVAERFGVKRVLLFALLIFMLGSFCSAISGTLSQLIFSRILQGMGAALMVPVVRITVMKIVPKEQFMAAMLYVTLPGQVGPLLGPSVGGLIVQFSSWHWIFLINIPVGLIAAFLILKLLPNYRSCVKRFDIIGFLLVAISMVTLSISLEGQKISISPFEFKLLIVVMILSLTAYIMHAFKAANPLFPLAMFTNRLYTIGIVSSVITRTGCSILPFLIPLYLQLCLHFTPSYSGLMLIPMVLGHMNAKRYAVKLVNKIGHRTLLILATFMISLFTLIFVTYASRDISVAIVSLVLIGISNSLVFATLNAITLKALPSKNSSQGSSFLSMLIQISTSIGVTMAMNLLIYFSPQGSGNINGISEVSFLNAWYVICVYLIFPIFIFIFLKHENIKERLINSKV